MDYRKTLFWLSTIDGDEDWFVVGADAYVAELHFINSEGYEFEHVSHKEICKVDFEDEECKNLETYFPSHEMLIKNGFQIISAEEPRILWKDGVKYCQGDIVKNIIIQRGKNLQGVYIISIRESGLYKIGQTKNIEKRLKQLQTGNPFEFLLIKFFETSKFKELDSALHKKFKKNKYKNEWYKLNDTELRDACYFSRKFIGRPYKSEDLNKSSKTGNRDLDNNDLPF